jgi:hypothetical protein
MPGSTGAAPAWQAMPRVAMQMMTNHVELPRMRIMKPASNRQGVANLERGAMM